MQGKCYALANYRSERRRGKTMNKRLAALGITSLAVAIFALLWYVAGGFRMPEMVILASMISASIAYLFYEAIACAKIRKSLFPVNLVRRLDAKELARIFGPVALLPTAAITLSRYAYKSSIAPLRLYVLFVLLFLVGWALGTVETSRLIEEKE